MTLPVNMMFVDSRGQSARMVVENQDTRWVH